MDQPKRYTVNIAHPETGTTSSRQYFNADSAELAAEALFNLGYSTQVIEIATGRILSEFEV